MELVVANLTGPMRITTWSGMAYALVVVEASMRFVTARLLRTKREAANALKDIITVLERQSGQKVKKIMYRQWHRIR